MNLLKNIADFNFKLYYAREFVQWTKGIKGT